MRFCDDATVSKHKKNKTGSRSVLVEVLEVLVSTAITRTEAWRVRGTSLAFQGVMQTMTNKELDVEMGTPDVGDELNLHCKFFDELNGNTSGGVGCAQHGRSEKVGVSRSGGKANERREISNRWVDTNRGGGIEKHSVCFLALFALGGKLWWDAHEEEMSDATVRTLLQCAETELISPLRARHWRCVLWSIWSLALRAGPTRIQEHRGVSPRQVVVSQDGITSGSNILFSCHMFLVA